MNTTVAYPSGADTGAGNPSPNRAARRRMTRPGANVAESLLYLALAIGVVIGTFALYRGARASQLTNGMISGFNTVASNTRAQYANQPTFGAAAAVLTGVVGAANGFNAPFNFNPATGVVTVAGTGGVVTVISGGTFFTITETLMTVSQCLKVANGIGDTSTNGPTQVTINGTANDFTAGVITAATWPALVTAQCINAGNTNTIAANYQP